MEIVNKILQILASKSFEIQSNGTLKKSNGKKSIQPSDFYKDNIVDFPDITPTNFISVIKELAQKLPPKEANTFTLSGLMQACSFVYTKFRWFVTREKTKVYYLKTSELAEEYYFLTTDKESVKFFNSLTLEELDTMNKLVLEFNRYNIEDPIDEEKLMKMIIADIRKNPAYCLSREPVTLTNDPTEPAFKFFDIQGLESNGDRFYTQHGHRPPTPAWDCFFARIREQKMVPLVKAYMAGLFIAKNQTKQALYIFGNGNDGKSQVTEALAKAMGEEITFMLPQNMKSNQFTMMDAYGKRMFLGEELQSPNVIKNGMLHAILGGSRVRLEPKGEAAFFGKIYACGVITSNYAPQIDDVKNQISRLLYIEMNPPTDEEINQSGREWSKALQDEFRSMIYDGYKYFKELNPSGASFKMPADYRDILSDLFDDKSKHINLFIEEAFEYNPDSEIKCCLLEGFIKYVKNHFFDEDDLSLPTDYRDNKIGKEIYEKLLVKFPKIYKYRKRVSGIQIRTIRGLSISQNEPSLMQFFEA